jgi:hypothetical protein
MVAAQLRSRVGKGGLGGDDRAQERDQGVARGRGRPPHTAAAFRQLVMLYCCAW